MIEILFQLLPSIRTWFNIVNSNKDNVENGANARKDVTIANKIMVGDEGKDEIVIWDGNQGWKPGLEIRIGFRIEIRVGIKL